MSGKRAAGYSVPQPVSRIELNRRQLAHRHTAESKSASPPSCRRFLPGHERDFDGRGEERPSSPFARCNRVAINTLHPKNHAAANLNKDRGVPQRAESTSGTTGKKN